MYIGVAALREFVFTIMDKIVNSPTPTSLFGRSRGGLALNVCNQTRADPLWPGNCRTGLVFV